MGPGETNHLLQSLEPHVLDRFAKQVEEVAMRRGDVLHQQGGAVDWVYFPRSGLVGVFSETLDGESVESAMVGCEGALGVFEACGSRVWFARAVVQLEGSALRMRASQYRNLFERSRAVRTAVHKYVEALLTEARQFVVCNALHSVESRLSRWILDAHDRSGVADPLPFTHETLARMIGAQRTTVAVAMSNFQRNGLLRNTRGSIEIADAAGLNRLACSCRDTIKFAAREIQASDTGSCEESLTG